jgi:hypothetical protein
MSQSVHAAQEPSLFAFEESLENASILESVKPETPVSADLSILNSKAVWGFSLLVIILLARVFGQKKKLPAGAKPLPKLPGELREPDTLLSVLTTAARYSMDRPLLGYSHIRSRSSMALW